MLKLVFFFVLFSSNANAITLCDKEMPNLLKSTHILEIERVDDSAVAPPGFFGKILIKLGLREKTRPKLTKNNVKYFPKKIIDENLYKINKVWENELGKLEYLDILVEEYSKKNYTKPFPTGTKLIIFENIREITDIEGYGIMKLSKCNSVIETNDVFNKVKDYLNRHFK